MACTLWMDRKYIYHHHHHNHISECFKRHMDVSSSTVCWKRYTYMDVMSSAVTTWYYNRPLVLQDVEYANAQAGYQDDSFNSA